MNRLAFGACLCAMAPSCTGPVEGARRAAAAIAGDDGTDYVLSIYYVPADGADGDRSLLNDGAYVTPNALAEAEVQSMRYGSSLRDAGFEYLSHSVGHAYVDMFTRAGGVENHDDPAFPTGQTGGGDATDVLQTGAGGTILGSYDGHMNTVAEASTDIALRKLHHGAAMTYSSLDPTPDIASAQLLGRTDFLLNQATWRAVKDRIALHVAKTSMRYALFLDPAKQSQRPGVDGGEGAGCTSFAAMTMMFSGALSRAALNPAWTRKVTIGSSLVDPGTFIWGSHILSPWPRAANVAQTAHGFWNALAYDGAWTHGADEAFVAVPEDGSPSFRSEKRISGYWYDPDYMFFWAKGLYEAVRVGGPTTAYGRTWTAPKNRASSNSPSTAENPSYPYVETDARDATPKSTWDACPDTYASDWGACP